MNASTRVTSPRPGAISQAKSWFTVSGKGVVNGGSVTHGETFYNDTETLWWAKGGALVGESVASYRLFEAHS